MSPSYTVGCDGFLPWLKVAADQYNDVVLCEIEKLPFKDSSFETVIAVEVIEHLPQSSGLFFVRELERVSSEKVFISTPAHFHQSSSENPLDTHLSYWSPWFFRKMGYKVKGFGFRLIGSSAFNKLAELFIPPLFVSLFPRIAVYSVAYKEMLK